MMLHIQFHLHNSETVLLYHKIKSLDQHLNLRSQIQF